MSGRARAIAIALCVQALLLFSNLGLLPLWGDELFTLTAARLPWEQMLAMLQRDIHPPLYFAVQKLWLAVPVTGDAVVQMRLLSAIFLLCATGLTLRWASRILKGSSLWMLAAMLALSPYLILYGRMGRSYGLQMLLTLVAVAQLERVRREPGKGWQAAWLGVAVAAVAYAHYAPGIALALVAGVYLTPRPRNLLIAFTTGALLYAPWLLNGQRAVAKWHAAAGPYQVTGNALGEEVVKLGFTSLSLLFGESLPWPLLILAIVLTPALLLLAAIGLQRLWRADSRWIGPVLLLAVIGYAGVSRWVAYAFVPARLAFVFPFLLVLILKGVEAWPRTGRLVLGLWLAASVWGLSAYFRVDSYLNWAYAMPYPQMAADLAGGSEPCQLGLGLGGALPYYLPPGYPRVRIEPSVRGTIGQLTGERVCILRNTHDSSPDHYYAWVDQQLRRTHDRVATRMYRPRSAFDVWLMERLRWADASPYFYEITEYARRTGTR